MKNNKFQFYDLKINMKVEHMKKNAIGGLHQTVLQSKTDAMRSERTKLIQL